MSYPQGPHTVTSHQAEDQDPRPHIPLYTRFCLDGGRSQELSRFYQVRTQGTVEGSQSDHSLRCLPMVRLLGAPNSAKMPGHRSLPTADPAAPRLLPGQDREAVSRSLLRAAHKGKGEIPSST